MKIGKKLKWTLGLIGLTSISIIPMSIALTSCGNNSEFSSDFVEDMTDPNSSICIDQSKYDQILNINKNYKNLVNKEYTSNPIQVAQNWLKKATEDEIEELLFINFNRCDEITQNGMSGNDAWFTKKFCDVEVTNYNSESKVVNFKLKIYFNEYISEAVILDKNDPYNEYGIDFNDELRSYEQTYLEYEINNFKFTVYDASNDEFTSNKSLPILSLEKLDNSSIKCINSNAKFETNEFEIQRKLLKAIKDKLSNADINAVESEINNYEQYISNCEENFKNIPNLDWSVVTQYPQKSYHDGYNDFPFTSYGDSWETSIVNIETIGISKYSSSDDKSIQLKSYYTIPLFVISQFNSDNSNIEVIQ